MSFSHFYDIYIGSARLSGNRENISRKITRRMPVEVGNDDSEEFKRRALDGNRRPSAHSSHNVSATKKLLKFAKAKKAKRNGAK